MAVLREALRLVERQPDGTYTCNNVPLRKPGEGALCALAAIAVEDATGADDIVISGGADWLVEIGGAQYNIILGVEQDTAEILLLGNSMQYTPSPPEPPVIYPDGLSAVVAGPVKKTVTLDGPVKHRYNPDGTTVLTVTLGQAHEMLTQLTAILEAAEKTQTARAVKT